MIWLVREDAGLSGRTVWKDVIVSRPRPKEFWDDVLRVETGCDAGADRF
jgi:hypothetical protein